MLEIATCWMPADLISWRDAWIGWSGLCGAVNMSNELFFRLGEL